MASTWLTDVADVVGGYYGRTQPKYNAARNREIAYQAAQDANKRFSSLLASEYPDSQSFDPTEIKAREALLSGLPRDALASGSQPAIPIISQPPSSPSAAPVAPEPRNMSAPMLTLPNKMYAHEAADVARGIFPGGAGSSEYKQSGSSSGATPAQSAEAHDEYRKTAAELTAKSKSLAINAARLEYMKQMAPEVRAKMFGTEEADLFDKEVANLSKEVEGDQAAHDKALTKKAELDQKITVSSKQAESQQARIELARAAKETDNEWRKKNAAGKLDLDWAKLHIQNLQNYQKNALDRYRTEMQFAGSQGGTQQLFASQKVAEMMQHLTHGQQVLDVLNASGAATGEAILDKDREFASRVVTQFLDSVVKTADTNDFVLTPAEPPKGWYASMFGGGGGDEKSGAVANAATSRPPSLVALQNARFDPNMGGPGGEYATQSSSGTGAPPPPSAQPSSAKKVSKLPGAGKSSKAGAKPQRSSFAAASDYIAAVSAWRKAGGKD